tara:strand:- start:151 stop:504 length:354 start_codon:yes stop_codon:yes gene_type:complete
MKRLASDILRSLENRVARLERQAKSKDPVVQAIKDLDGTQLEGYTLKVDNRDNIVWAKGDYKIYVSYNSSNFTFLFQDLDSTGNLDFLSEYQLGKNRGIKDAKKDFLTVSRKVLKLT